MINVNRVFSIEINRTIVRIILIEIDSYRSLIFQRFHPNVSRSGEAQEEIHLD